MAKPQEFEIQESKEALKKLRRVQPNIRFEKRVLWLIYIQNKKFKTRKELSEYLNISPRTQERWTKKYINHGVDALLSDLPKNKKSKIITPEIHSGLEDYLKSSGKKFSGYRATQEWVNSTYNINIKYHWLRQYLIKHFKTS